MRAGAKEVCDKKSTLCVLQFVKRMVFLHANSFKIMRLLADPMSAVLPVNCRTGTFTQNSIASVIFPSVQFQEWSSRFETKSQHLIFKLLVPFTVVWLCRLIAIKLEQF